VSDPRIDAIIARTIDVPDFPKPGIVFKDLTPVFSDRQTFQDVVELFAEAMQGEIVEAVVGIEARGFILASALAVRLGVGFVPVRKPGKLPRETIRETYALEYGTDALEMHADALTQGARVVLVDDVLATGGTARAAADLIRRGGGDIARTIFLLEIGFLNGRSKLEDVSCHSLITVGA